MQEGYAPVGVLADFLEVDDRYEHVVDDFLRDELNYVVVKSWDAADHGLEMLRTGVDGRATFLVHPEDSQARFSFLRENASSLAYSAAARQGRSSTAAEELHPRAQWVRQVAGGDSAQAARWVYRS